MNEFIMTDIFKDSVAEKDLAGIRSCISESICRDPAFFTGSFEAHMEHVNRHHVKITEPYKKREDEFELPEEEWNNLYFYRMVEWFRLNFAPDERLEQLKVVGRKVFPPKEELTPQQPKGVHHERFQSVPPGRRNAECKPSIPLIIGGAVAAIAVIVLILQLLRKG